MPSPRLSPTLARRASRLAVLCLLAGFAATPGTTGCGKENNVTTNNSNTYNTTNNVTQVLGAQGGFVENVPVGGRVDLPPGALTEEVSLVVAELADPSGLPLPAGFVAVSKLVVFEPAAQTFATEVTLSIAHTAGPRPDVRLLRADPGGAWAEVSVKELTATRVIRSSSVLGLFVAVVPEGAAPAGGSGGGGGGGAGGGGAGATGVGGAGESGAAGMESAAGTSGEGGGKSGDAGAGGGDGGAAGKVATLPPGCSTGFGLGGGLCQGKGKPIVWATAGELVASGDGGLEAPAGQGWTNVATAASFGPGEDFCVAWQAALGGGYNQIMAGVRFETFAGNFLDRGIYLDQPYTCLFFSPTDSFTNRCDSVAPGVTINHAAGECALVEVRRVAGQVDVAVNGEVMTSDAEDGAVTPSVLIYNSIGRISSAYSY
jgi:hypothetical protein